MIEGPVLSERERTIAERLAEAAIPGGDILAGGGRDTVVRFEQLLETLGPDVAKAARAGLWALEAWAMRSAGRPLSSLSPEARARVVEAWAESTSRYERWALRGTLSLLKSAHFDDPKTYDHVGCKRDFSTPAHDEPAPWMASVVDGRQATEDLDLSCEVVVVGTGAGGAACAYELAKRGRAVLLVEGGHYYRRSDFVGRPVVSYKQLYLGLGSTIALGNVAAPVWAGRGVGGSTTINSGTCYRAPEWTLDEWRREHGLGMLGGGELDSYYERVEAMLGVEEAPRAHLGGVARVVARGADLLGLSHKPLRRNAPGCDGQGVCCFGCPTGAKRSTDVSYVPEALKRGASMVTGATVHRIEIIDGRARGVRARLASGKRLTVHAEAVVVAGGALLTPPLLWRNGLCAQSGWLGKNLSIHPATKVMALFDETIDMSRGIPQSYTIDSLHREGLLFEGASTPLDVTAVAIPWVGRRFTDVIEKYPNLATFGLMVKDTSRGRVLPGPGALPIIRYDLNRQDLALMQRGIALLTELFLRAGATRVLPMVTGQEEIRDEAGLAELRARKLSPGDFEVTAFHPLGTCRMGADPTRSCVDPEGQAHDVRGLVIADGSAIPSSLGVNPQMTIMALALRAAEHLDARLDRLGGSAPKSAPRPAFAAAPPSGAAAAPGGAGAGPPPKAPPIPKPRPRGVHLTFAETMRGTYTRLDDPGQKHALEFTLRARSRGITDLARTRVLDVEGEITAEGFGAHLPVKGTLALDVPATGMLPYDFAFTADDGKVYRFVGQKRVRALALLETMTRLPARIVSEDGHEVGVAEVFFDLAELPGFLWGWRLARR